jgi:hypothetical protein
MDKQEPSIVSQVLQAWEDMSDPNKQYEEEFRYSGALKRKEAKDGTLV